MEEYRLLEPILLVGMPAVGKSYFGERLSKAFGVPFYDSDKLISQKFGANISDVFSKLGEKGFREAESSIIGTLLSNFAPVVIATGGGSLETTEAQNLLKTQNLIYLRAPLDIIHRRLLTKAHSKRHFPKFFGCGDCDSFLSECCISCSFSILKQVEKKRTPIYENLSSITINIPATIQNIIEEITKKAWAVKI